jgi:phosphoserine phosphatase
MLGNAGFGVAFAGKPILREKVALQLNHTDLTGLLFLQGYRQDQFVTDH